MQLHAIVVTFRRPAELEQVLVELSRQSRPPDTITVVDNDPAQSAASVVESSPTVRYVPAGQNLGPAGGLAVGVDEVDQSASDEDCVVFVDDNDPPPSPSTLEDLLAFREECPVGPDRLGAVGLAGARYRRRTGMLRRLDDSELVGSVRVNYLGGGQFPIYSVSALREAGGPRADLFFGFEELELGLRLEDHGRLLFGAGDLWAARRTDLGRDKTSARRAASGRIQLPWRRYYSVRNLVWVTRTYGGVVPALTCTIRSGLGGAVRDGIRQRSLRATAPALRGVYHGWAGRLGITTPVP